MATVLDKFAVAILVSIALLYAIYALGPARLKTWILTQVGCYLGLRVLGLMLRKSSTGCEGCSAAGTHHPIKSNDDAKEREKIKPAR